MRDESVVRTGKEILVVGEVIGKIVVLDVVVETEDGRDDAAMQVSVSDFYSSQGQGLSTHKAPSQKMPITFHFRFVLRFSFLIIGNGIARTARSNTISSTA